MTDIVHHVLRLCAEPGCRAEMIVDPSVYFCPAHTPGHCQRCRAELTRSFLCEACRCYHVAHPSTTFDELDAATDPFETGYAEAEGAEPQYQEALTDLSRKKPRNVRRPM